MHVHHGLACTCADVDADIETIRVALLGQVMLPGKNQVPGGLLLLGSEIEKLSDMPERNNQDVTWAHRVAIVACITEFVLEDDLALGHGTEWALFIHIWLCDG